MGRKVPGPMDRAGHALMHRAHEAGCQDAAQPPRIDPELLPRKKAVLHWGRRGPEQQSQSDHEKVVRISDLPDHGNRAISCTWQTAGARTHPQVLLTKHLLNAGPVNRRSVKLRQIGQRTDIDLLGDLIRVRVARVLSFEWLVPCSVNYALRQSCCARTQTAWPRPPAIRRTAFGRARPAYWHLA